MTNPLSFRFAPQPLLKRQYRTQFVKVSFGS
jgi:hypothetical protein